MIFNFTLNEQTYKKLMILPMALLALSIFFLASSYLTSGEFLKKSIDLEGGVQIVVHHTKETDLSAFESFLRKALGTTDVDVTKTTDPATRQPQTLIISVEGNLPASKVILSVENFLEEKLEPKTYSITTLGPSLAASFWKQAVWALVFAFIFMAFVVFFYFRTVYSSLTIMVSIIADLIVILGFMSFLGIKLSLATIGAMLTILGYGVDSNILLSTKIVKEREGTAFERISTTLKTGLTMSSATISTLIMLLIVSNSLVIQQIAAVILIGLVSDLLYVWVFNANLLIWRLKQ